MGMIFMELRLLGVIELDRLRFSMKIRSLVLKYFLGLIILIKDPKYDVLILAK
jgi:hypothetical protein